MASTTTAPRRPLGAQVAADGGDGGALDEQVADREGAECGVHGDDRRAGEQDAAVRVGGGAAQLIEDSLARGVVEVHGLRPFTGRDGWGAFGGASGEISLRRRGSDNQAAVHLGVRHPRPRAAVLGNGWIAHDGPGNSSTTQRSWG